MSLFWYQKLKIMFHLFARVKPHLNKSILLVFIILRVFNSASGQVSKYNVQWRTLSSHSMEAMPLGNGDIGINLWADTAGIHFYMGKTDTWSGNGRLLKPGLVHVFLPSMKKIHTFTQELKLETGEICLNMISDSFAISGRFWVDANYPVVRIALAGDRSFNCKATLQCWRNKEKILPNSDYFHSAYSFIGSPDPVVIEPDTILEGFDNKIIWFHRNIKSITFRG